MRRRSPASLACVAVLVASGCGCANDRADDAESKDAGGAPSDAAVTPSDAEVTDARASRFACDPGIAPLSANGVGGGPLTGKLSVFVREQETRSALVGATIVVEFDGNQLSASTDVSGCVQFEDPGLFGSIAAHVFAPDRIHLSLVGFDAAVMSVSLARDVPSATTDTATVSGVVTGFDVLTASTATIARVGFVDAITRDVFSSTPEQATRAANPNIGTNVVLVGRNGTLDFQDYAIRVIPEATTGLGVSAGTVTFPRFGSPVVEITHYGFVTGLDLSPGDEVTGRDIAITHPLNQTVTLSYGSAPNLPRFLAASYVVLPGEGGWFFHAVGVLRGDHIALFPPAPELTGVLEGGTYGGLVQVAGDTAFSLIVEPGSSSPNLDLGDLRPVPDAIAAEGRTISAAIEDPGQDIVFFVLGDRGKPRWAIVWAHIPENPSLTLPEAPEGIADPLAGELDLTVQRIQYDGIDFDRFSFNQLLDSKVRSVAGDTVKVSF